MEMLLGNLPGVIIIMDEKVVVNQLNTHINSSNTSNQYHQVSVCI